jgi:hypothetical protein
MLRKISLAGAALVLLGALPLSAQLASVSISPLMVFQALATPGEEVTDAFELIADCNFEGDNGENSLGMVITGYQVGFRGQMRRFVHGDYGFFAGLWGQAEFRQMYWKYDDAETKEGLSLTTYFWTSGGGEGEHKYSSVGATLGGHVGYRLKFHPVGVTAYVGLGFPLFYCFGSLPEDNDTDKFYLMNGIIRAVDLGLKIDLFF